MTIAYDLSHPEDSVAVPANNKFVHPDFNWANVDYDLALLILPRSTTADVGYVEINKDPRIPDDIIPATYLGATCDVQCLSFFIITYLMHVHAFLSKGWGDTK